MRFKEFLLKEVGTSTGDIAGFRRIAIPMVRRMWPPMIATMVSDNPPNKKIKMQPQVKEGEMMVPSFLTWLENKIRLQPSESYALGGGSQFGPGNRRNPPKDFRGKLGSSNWQYSDPNAWHEPSVTDIRSPEEAPPLKSSLKQRVGPEDRVDNYQWSAEDDMDDDFNFDPLEEYPEYPDGYDDEDYAYDNVYGTDGPDDYTADFIPDDEAELAAGTHRQDRDFNRNMLRQLRGGQSKSDSWKKYRDEQYRTLGK